MSRNYSLADKICQCIGQSLQTMFTVPPSPRPRPQASTATAGAAANEPILSEQERKHSAALMRINHTGEVCAQALYQGQALTAHKPETALAMQQAAEEENEHLNWCATRLQELDSRTSYLNPLWYCGSLAMGVSAGLIGDAWSLGFVAETERQVCAHLESHLEQLPEQDLTSRAIVSQMQIDEQHHGEMATAAGSRELPLPVKWVMRSMAKVMTRVTYYC